MKIGDLYRSQNDFQAAKSVVIKLDSILEKFPDSNELQFARKKYLEAKILSNMGDFVNANSDYEKIILLVEELQGKNSPELAKIYNNKGVNHFFQSEFDQAMRDYRETTRICEANGLRNIDLADALQNMAIVLTIQGDFDSAMLVVNQSKEIREELFEPISLQLGTFYLNYGRFLSITGEIERSLEYYLKSESILKDLDYTNSYVLGVLLQNTAGILQIQGDYDKAKMYYSNGLWQIEKVLDNEHPSVITAKRNLAYVYYLSGDYTSAKNLLNVIIDVEVDPITKISMLNDIANVYDAIGNKDSASFYFTKALEFSENKLGATHYETAQSLIHAGNFYLNFKNPSLALEHYEKALKIFIKNFGPTDREVGFACINMAQSYYELGNFTKADSLYDCAEEIFEPIIGQMLNDNLSADRIADVRIMSYFTGRASLYRSWYDQTNKDELLYASLALLKNGMDLVDRIGMSITDDSRILLNEGVRSMLADVMDVCFTLYELTGDKEYVGQAFTFSGRSKAAVLLSSVRKMSALQAGGVPQHVTEEERNLNERISSLRKLIFDEQQSAEPDHNRISFLESRHFNLVRKYDSLVGFIENNYADYYTLRYDNQVVNIDQVQQQLKADEVLLEYVLTNDMVYIFAVSPQQVKLVRSREAAAVSASIEALRKQVKLDFSNHGHSDYLEFLTAAHHLYNSLIKPMEANIIDKRLLIIPDGLLGYIPFELLIEELPEKNDRIEYYDLSYLLRKSAISYAYSATLRFDGKQPQKKKGRSLLAFVPDYGNSDIMLISPDLRSGLDLTPLPFALEEAENVKASMGGRILHAEKANKMNFQKVASDYDILHLAMHAQINDQNPLYSRLIFQPLSDSIDAFTLNTYELYGLQLNAQLVVLSACNTGAGKLQQGEGVMSLTRGFVYAGVPSIVMTAWEVHDESGALMMDHFYKLLSVGIPKDVALQQAKLAFLDQANQLKSHPYFWSAYILIGDAEPLAPPKRTFWWVVLSFALFAALLLFFYGRHRSLKRLKDNR